MKTRRESSREAMTLDQEKLQQKQKDGRQSREMLTG